MQDRDVALGDGVAVLEPEVEEVAADVERRALFEDDVEETQEVAFAGAIGVGRALAQMGIRDKIGAPGFGHAASV
jgi:hypothetical protein